MDILTVEQIENIAKNKIKKLLNESNNAVNVIALMSADGTITITDAHTGEVLIQNNPNAK